MINVFLLNEARELTETMISILETVEQNYRNAGIWSVSDLLGGIILSGIFKYLNVTSANAQLEKFNNLTLQLNSILGDLEIPLVFKDELFGFSTLADFIFDGIIIDAFTSIKILSSLVEVKNLKNRLVRLDNMLESLY